MRLNDLNFKYKKELILDEKRILEWSIGYSLCTVHRCNYENDTIELWNFGYQLSSNEFYYTRNVHLSKKLINYFVGLEYNEQNIKDIEKLGVYSDKDLCNLVNSDGESIKETIKLQIKGKVEKQKVLKR